MCMNRRKLLSLWILVTVSLVTLAADICILVIYGTYIQHQRGKYNTLTHDVKTWIIDEVWNSIFRAKLSVGMLMLLCSGLLVSGVRKEKRLLLLPWVGCALVLTVLNILSMKNNIHRYGLVTINIYRLLVVILLGVLNMFFIWQVMSYYKDMERISFQRRQAQLQDELEAVELAGGPVLTEAAIVGMPMLQPIYQNGSTHIQPCPYTPPPDYNSVINQPLPGVHDAMIPLAPQAPPSYEEALRQARS